MHNWKMEYDSRLSYFYRFVLNVDYRCDSLRGSYIYISLCIAGLSKKWSLGPPQHNFKPFSGQIKKFAIQFKNCVIQIKKDDPYLK